MPILNDAITFATQAHKDQTDKNGDPYILHPLRVMGRVQSDAEKIVAVLHDIVEDTPCTFQDLRDKGYSEQVIEAIDCLTKRGEEESYDDFIERCQTNPIALRVKIADLEDNMDIRRLDVFTEGDLMHPNKYLKAWRRLTKVG